MDYVLCAKFWSIPGLHDNHDPVLCWSDQHSNKSNIPEIFEAGSARLMHVTHAHIESVNVIGSHTQVVVILHCIATNNWVASTQHIYNNGYVCANAISASDLLVCCHRDVSIFEMLS